MEYENKKMIAYRNEVLSECLSACDCFAKNLISDVAVIRYLCDRDFRKMKEANPKLPNTIIYSEIADKYCLSPLTVQLYHYHFKGNIKGKFKRVYFEQPTNQSNSEQ